MTDGASDGADDAREVWEQRRAYEALERANLDWARTLMELRLPAGVDPDPAAHAREAIRLQQWWSELGQEEAEFLMDYVPSELGEHPAVDLDVRSSCHRPDSAAARQVLPPVILQTRPLLFRAREGYIYGSGLPTGPGIETVLVHVTGDNPAIREAKAYQALIAVCDRRAVVIMVSREPRAAVASRGLDPLGDLMISAAGKFGDIPITVGCDPTLRPSLEAMVHAYAEARNKAGLADMRFAPVLEQVAGLSDPTRPLPGAVSPPAAPRAAVPGTSGSQIDPYRRLVGLGRRSRAPGMN